MYFDLRFKIKNLASSCHYYEIKEMNTLSSEEDNKTQHCLALFLIERSITFALKNYRPNRYRILPGGRIAEYNTYKTIHF